MKKIIIYISFCLFLQACFSTPIEIEPPAYIDKLVISSYLTTTDSMIYVNISKTRPSIGESGGAFDYLNDSTISIRLYKNEELYQEIPYTNLRKSHEEYYQSTLPLNINMEGQTFRLEAISSTYNIVTATQIMPYKVPILSANFQEGIGVNNQLNGGVTATFKDPPNEQNYYLVSLIQSNEKLNHTDKYKYDMSSVMPSNDVLEDWFTSSSISRVMMMNDETFDGQTFTFSLFLQQKFNTQYMYLVFTHITEDFYLALKTQKKHHEFGLFTEPFNDHSNIENGLGIFGAGARELYEIKR